MCSFGLMLAEKSFSYCPGIEKGGKRKGVSKKNNNATAKIKIKYEPISRWNQDQ